MTGAVRGGRHGARAIAEAGADLVLTGHVHVPFALPLPFGDGRTYAVGASTLSVRERGVPPGFNCITADPECIHVVAMGWAGSHYEPWRTWGLDRRVTGNAKGPDRSPGQALAYHRMEGAISARGTASPARRPWRRRTAWRPGSQLASLSNQASRKPFRSFLWSR